MQPNCTSEVPRLRSISREAFWLRHVEQWRESGLSKMAYCQQNSLVYHQMVYWSSKSTRETDVAKGASNDFIAVSVTPTLAHSGLSVRRPNGIAIEGIDERSVALVGKLVDQL